MRLRHAATLVASITAILCAYGCTPNYMRYVSNTDATETQFLQDRYQCLQETAHQVSGAYVNAYGGAASSQVMPSCSAFNACLAARGYYRSDTTNLADLNVPGSLYVPSSAVIQCAQ